MHLWTICWATPYRLDAYGTSKWIDPLDQHDRSVLTADNYKTAYNGIDFQSAAAMGRYLNEKGIDHGPWKP